MVSGWHAQATPARERFWLCTPRYGRKSLRRTWTGVIREHRQAALDSVVVDPHVASLLLSGVYEEDKKLVESSQVAQVRLAEPRPALKAPLEGGTVVQSALGRAP